MTVSEAVHKTPRGSSDILKADRQRAEASCSWSCEEQKVQTEVIIDKVLRSVAAHRQIVGGAFRAAD